MTTDQPKSVRRSGRIVSGDQLLPLYVMDAMSKTPGLTGLFLAGVCSSAMCSASAALNSLAAVTLEDYITVNAFYKLTLKLLCIYYYVISIMNIIFLKN